MSQFINDCLKPPSLPTTKVYTIAF